MDNVMTSPENSIYDEKIVDEMLVVNNTKAWKLLDPQRSNTRTAKEFISISQYRIVFSKGFIRNHDLQKFINVMIFVNPEKKKIGFRFFDVELKNAFKISLMGNTRVCTVTALLREHPWIVPYVTQTPSKRKFKPYLDEKNRVWSIDLPDLP